MNRSTIKQLSYLALAVAAWCGWPFAAEFVAVLCGGHY